jgi:outer membrane protein assembly factor BamB
VAGTFTGGIAALNATTGALVWTANADNEVSAVAVSEDGTRVMAGGNFVTVNGQTRKRLVALNASDGSVVGNWSPRATGKVTALAVDGDRLYVGGRFGSLSGSHRKGLAAVNIETGQRLQSFDHFVDKPVESLAIGGGRLIVAGRFTRVDGSVRASLASINLTNHALTSWSPQRVCPTCFTYWDVATDGVNAYVGSSGPGGQFAAFNLNTGQMPWPYIHTDGDVQAVAVGPDGYVYLGGHFAQYVRNQNFPRTQMANINAATGAVGPFAPVMYNSYPGVWTVVATPDRLYVGGTFGGVQENGQNNHKSFLALFGH